MNIIDYAEKLLHADLSAVEFREADDVCVEQTSGKATVWAGTPSGKLRGLALYLLNRQSGDFRISETRRFEKFGVMIDVSRGGVMRPERVKEFIFRSCLCGANLFSLYMEDVYTLSDYKHFGYLRGAYTDDELKEIVAFAEALGAEVVPAIQTLGHMAQYLSWKNETDAMKDTRSVLLAEKDETYRFLEAELDKIKLIFKTDRVHIGMDEAHDVGLGKYLKTNGYKDRYRLLLDHLDRVTDMCRSRGLSPIMWSDMFFRLSSETGDYYDLSAPVREDIRDRLGGVSLMYWDYYHDSPEHFEKMFSRHRKLTDSLCFAGAVCTFRGMFPDFGTGFRCMVPALNACIDNGIGEVWATMWGDDGCEADYFDALYGFALFGEYCFNGKSASLRAAVRMGELISGISEKNAAAMTAVFYDKFTTPLYWGDIFYNATGEDYADGRAEKQFMAFAESDDELISAVLRILGLKAHIYGKLQAAYRSGESLQEYLDGILPHLLEALKTAKRLHLAKFKRTNKVFGLEVLQSRYATAINRTEYAIEVLRAFEEGKTDRIEELDYTPQYGDTRGRFYNGAAFSRSTDVSL